MLKNLEAYIATLTDKEKESHKELIAECRSRARLISTYAEMRRTGMEELDKAEVKFAERLYELEKAGHKLLERTAEIYLKISDKGTTRYSC